MTNTPPVWVISLRESKDRRHQISHQLKAAGLVYEFQDAVNGRDLSDETLSDCYDPYGAVTHTGGQLSLGAIACTLSHAALWQRMLDENIDEVIILEDDAVLTTDFVPLIENRAAFTPDWELVLLYSGTSRYSIWRQSRVYHQFKLVKFVSYVAGAVAYIIRKPAAEKLLKAGIPVCAPADYLTGGWLATGVRMYGVQPNCVTHPLNTTTRSSTPVTPEGDYQQARQEYLRTHSHHSEFVEKISSLYKRIHPAFAHHDS